MRAAAGMMVLRPPWCLADRSARGRYSGCRDRSCCWRRCNRAACRRPCPWRCCPSSGRWRRAHRCPAGRHGRRAAGIAQLIPAHADRVAGGDGVVDHQRLVIAEVAIGQAIHQAVGEESSCCVVPGCGMQVRRRQARVNAATAMVVGPVKRGVGRCREVDVELPQS